MAKNCQFKKLYLTIIALEDIVNEMSTSENFPLPQSQKNRKIWLVLGSVFYLILYIALYWKYVPRILNLQLILIPIVLMAMALTVYSIRYGTLVIVALIPLVNSLPYFFGLSGFNPLFFVFYGYVLGILVHQLLHPVSLYFKNQLSLPILGATLVLIISVFLTFWRYTNFFPVHTSSVFEYAVNVLNVSAGEALRRVLFDGLSYLAGFIWFYMVVNELKRKKIIYLAVTLLAVTALFSYGFGIYQDVAHSGLGNQDYFAAASRLNALFTDPNALGVFLILTIPVFTGLFLIKKRFARLLFGLTLGCGLYLIPDAGSRVGMLGVALGIGFFLILVIRLGIKARKSNPKFGRLVVTHVAAAVLLVGLISGFIMVNKQSNLYTRFVANIQSLRLTDEFRHITREIILHGRHLTWPASLHMIREYPVSGIGVGAFTPELPNFFKTYSIAPVVGSAFYRKNLVPDFHVDSAGNYYLQVASEMGLVGLAFFLWIFYLVLKRIYKVNFKDKEISEDRFLGVGLSSAILAMFIAFSFGAHTVNFEIQMTFWMFVGLLYVIPTGIPNAIPESRSKKTSPSPLLKTVLGLLLVVFAAGHAWNSYHSLSLRERTEKYHLFHEFGLYQKETMDGRDFRWTGKAAALTVKVENKGVLAVPVLASHPDIEQNPVRVKVYVTEDLFRNTELIDEFDLRDSVWKVRQYDFSNRVGSEVLLYFEIGRTWRPREALGSSDPRTLGIALGTVQFQ
ncbi:O-antigen ligase family protein [Acidobacteriota bacterium]